MITKYLIDLGHKHIAGVFKADDTQGQNRHKGYVRALQEAGMPYDPDMVVWFYTEDRKIHPYEGIQNIAKNKELDAVVCYNDQNAMGVIRALEALDLKIPEDVSITGYDNFYMANQSDFRLTSIAHPQEKLGEMAAELLIDLIVNGENAQKQKIMIEPELVEGTSCRRR